MSEVAVLAQQLQHKQVAVRAQAAEQLCHCGAGAAAAAVALVEASGDEEPVREWAVAALEDCGPPPREAMDRLAGLVAHRHELPAYWAVTLLGRLGPAAAGVAPVLVTALTASPHPAVRQRAAWALGEIGDRQPATVAALERAKGETDPRLARLAAQALEHVR